MLGTTTLKTHPQSLELRRSRRLAGLPPFSTRMQQTTEQPRTSTRDPLPSSRDAPPTTTNATLPFREPRSFAGQAGEDVDDWLTHYERVSRYNRWDSVAKLANVVFFLTQTALMWYENHEDSLTTWESFVEAIKECFGDLAAKKKQAEQTLAQRAQAAGETCTTYIEAILKLCKTVDSRMTEDDKVGHLLKGIAEDVYHFLIAKENLSSVSDVIRHCRTFEALKTRRITPKFGRLANVTTVASIEESPSQSLLCAIREIVRDEMSRREQLVRPNGFGGDVYARPTYGGACPPMSANVTDFVCREDLYTPRPRPEENFQQFSCHQRRDPRSYSSRTSRRPPDNYIVPEPPSGYSSRPTMQEPADTPLFERPLPVCYRCGAAGHISRYCNRRASFRNPPTASNRRTVQPYIDSYRPEHPSRRGRFQNEGHRSHSPASDRSVTPPPSFRVRRSPSPRRRSPPPTQEN